MNLQKPIRGIFLDMGWTMLKPDGLHWMLPPLLCERMGTDNYLALPQERRDAVTRDLIGYLDENHLITSVDEEKAQMLEFYRRFAAAYPELPLREADLAEIAHDKTYNFSNYILYDDTIEAVRALHARGYRLGILSDNWPTAQLTLEHYGLAEYFSAVTISSYLGVFKPHPKMYEHALGQMGLPAQETIFVDDGMDNLLGAAAQGIQPVLITREPELQEKCQGQTQFVQVDTLAELVEILDLT